MHTHCVIPNMARGEDGDWSALHHPTLFRTARTAGFLYQTHLRELVNERLGLEWGPVRNGVSELVDVPADVRGEFSRRKAELAEALAELQAAGKMQGVGIDGRDTFRVDGLRTVTRERKGEAVDLHAWRANVAARAAEHGLTRGDVNTLLTRAAGSARDVSGVPSDLAGRLAGPHGLTEKSNTFAEADVLREFAAAAAQGASVARVRQDAREFLARADVIELAGGRWTTQDLVDAERARESAQLGRADTRQDRRDVREGRQGRHTRPGAQRRATMGCGGDREVRERRGARPGAGGDRKDNHDERRAAGRGAGWPAGDRVRADRPRCRGTAEARRDRESYARLAGPQA